MITKGKFRKKEDFSKESLMAYDNLTLDILKHFAEKCFASISMTMRNFGIDRERATKIVDKLEKIGFISEADGSKAREVYITLEDYKKLFE